MGTAVKARLEVRELWMKPTLIIDQDLALNLDSMQELEVDDLHLATRN